MKAGPVTASAETVAEAPAKRTTKAKPDKETAVGAQERGGRPHGARSSQRCLAS